MMDKLQQAFKDWQDTFPGSRPGVTEYKGQWVSHLRGIIFKIPMNWDGDCQCPGGSSHHSYYKKIMDSPPRMIPRPDNEVCPRERAWRKYVRIRNGG